jgi:uncharacterized protein YdhG (YjbR/CyaY superfamily)
MVYDLSFIIFIFFNMPSKKNDIDIYFSKQPKEIQLALDRVRQTVMAVVPDAAQTINYGMPMIRYQCSMLVGFAAYKNHCSFFPCSGSAVSFFEEELKNFETTKGSIHFTLDKPLSLALIKKITKYRIQENEMKALAKKRKK